MVFSLVTMFTHNAFAVPTTVDPIDNDSFCDTLVVPENVDELGNQPPFPNNEWIDSSNTDTTLTACSDPNLSRTVTDLPGTVNKLVSITNRAPFAFSDLWYVIDEDGTMSNFDGTIAGRRTFKIDSSISDPLGIHHPLIFESITANDIFQPGERWDFILVDYFHGRSESASNFGTIGVPSGVQGVSDASTGNIIAINKIEVVGGTSLQIDTTALMLYYIQGTAAWMIPIIFAALGIGIILARKF